LYLAQRRLPVTPARWNPKTPLLASLDEDRTTGITGARQSNLMRRLLDQATDSSQQTIRRPPTSCDAPALTK
jgi:hypothetical protein